MCRVYVADHADQSEQGTAVAQRQLSWIERGPANQTYFTTAKIAAGLGMRSGELGKGRRRQGASSSGTAEPLNNGRVGGLVAVVVFVVVVCVRFRVRIWAWGAPCFWLYSAVLPAPGTARGGWVRSLTTPSPLRFDAVVNDLT